jgi:hypothetical protein
MSAVLPSFLLKARHNKACLTPGALQSRWKNCRGAGSYVRCSPKDPRLEKANDYHGPQLNDYAEKCARALTRAASGHFGTDLAAPRRERSYLPFSWQRQALVNHAKNYIATQLLTQPRAVFHQHPARAKFNPNQKDESKHYYRS